MNSIQQRQAGLLGWDLIYLFPMFGYKKQKVEEYMRKIREEEPQFGKWGEYACFCMIGFDS